MPAGLVILTNKAQSSLFTMAINDRGDLNWF